MRAAKADQTSRSRDCERAGIKARNLTRNDAEKPGVRFEHGGPIGPTPSEVIGSDPQRAVFAQSDERTIGQREGERGVAFGRQGIADPDRFTDEEGRLLAIAEDRHLARDRLDRSDFGGHSV